VPVVSFPQKLGHFQVTTPTDAHINSLSQGVWRRHVWVGVCLLGGDGGSVPRNSGAAIVKHCSVGNGIVVLGVWMHENINVGGEI
jgi:hypothetical protein